MSRVTVNATQTVSDTTWLYQIWSGAELLFQDVLLGFPDS